MASGSVQRHKGKREAPAAAPGGGAPGAV